MKRYTVDRSGDGRGNRYVSGPLRFVETDVLREAQHEVFERGGEVIDHLTRQGWSPGLGWQDASAYLDAYPE